MTTSYNPPVDHILCAQKNDTLVRYATSRLPEQLFTSKYRLNLPSEAELQALLQQKMKGG